MPHWSNRIKAIVLLPALQLAMPVFAQPPGTPGGEQRLPEVTVTADTEAEAATYGSAATKTDTALIETPQSISVVTDEQMEAQNVGSLAEALRYMPGIQGETFGFEPRTTFLRIRGFDATTTGLFRDGLKLSNPGFAVGYNLEPYGAERIEVPRGPASVLYGQASPGGLVNFVTKRPTGERLREVEVEAGSFDRVQAKFDLGGAVDETGVVSYRLTGVARESDTQVDFVEDNRVYIAPALAWRLNRDTTLTLLSHFQRDETRPSQRLPADGTLRSNPHGRIPTNRFTGEPAVDQYDRDEFALGYLLEHRLNDAWTLRQNLRYYDNEVDDRTIYPTALLGDQRTVSRALFESFGEVDGFTVDNQAQVELSTGAVRHTVLAGLDYQRADMSSLQTFGTAPNLDIFAPVYGSAVAAAPVFKDEDVTQTHIGFYLQDQMTLADKWVLTLGGRYDRAGTETRNNLTSARTDQDDSEFTGRAGVVYLAENGIAPYFSYSESFLPALGTDPSGQPFQPETGRQYEAGVKYQPPGRDVFATLALFDLTRKNFPTTDPSTFADVQRGEARSRGVEIEGVMPLAAGLKLIASYTYLDAVITESSVPAEVGEPLDYASKHKASLWADYTPHGESNGWGFGGGARYIGSSYAASFAARNTVEVPSVTLFDALARYDWQRFQFALNVHNVFDKEYVASAFTSGGLFATYGQRRTVIGSVKYRW